MTLEVNGGTKPGLQVIAPFVRTELARLLELQADCRIRNSKKIAEILYREIKEASLKKRRSAVFVKDIYKKLLFLHDFHQEVKEKKRRFPFSKILVKVVVEYVQLEHNALYAPERNYLESEKEVENRIINLIENMFLPYDKKPVPACCTNPNSLFVLKVLYAVASEYRSDNNLFGNLVRKLLKKLGLWNTVKNSTLGICNITTSNPAVKMLSLYDINELPEEYDTDDEEPRSFNSDLSKLSLQDSAEKSLAPSLLEQENTSSLGKSLDMKKGVGALDVLETICLDDSDEDTIIVEDTDFSATPCKSDLNKSVKSDVQINVKSSVKLEAMKSTKNKPSDYFSKSSSNKAKNTSSKSLASKDSRKQQRQYDLMDLPPSTSRCSNITLKNGTVVKIKSEHQIQIVIEEDEDAILNKDADEPPKNDVPLPQQPSQTVAKQSYFADKTKPAVSDNQVNEISSSEIFDIDNNCESINQDLEFSVHSVEITSTTTTYPCYKKHQTITNGCSVGTSLVSNVNNSDTQETTDFSSIDQVHTSSRLAVKDYEKYFYGADSCLTTSNISSNYREKDNVLNTRCINTLPLSGNNDNTVTDSNINKIKEVASIHLNVDLDVSKQRIEPEAPKTIEACQDILDLINILIEQVENSCNITEIENQDNNSADVDENLKEGEVVIEKSLTCKPTEIVEEKILKKPDVAHISHEDDCRTLHEENIRGNDFDVSDNDPTEKNKDNDEAQNLNTDTNPQSEASFNISEQEERDHNLLQSYENFDASENGIQNTTENNLEDIFPRVVTLEETQKATSVNNEPLINEISQNSQEIVASVSEVQEERRCSNTNINCENESSDISTILQQQTCEESIQNSLKPTQNSPKSIQSLSETIQGLSESASEMANQQEREDSIENTPEIISLIPKNDTISGEYQKVDSIIDDSSENGYLGISESSASVKQHDCKEISQNSLESDLSLLENRITSKENQIISEENVKMTSDVDFNTENDSLHDQQAEFKESVQDLLEDPEAPENDTLSEENHDTLDTVKQQECEETIGNLPEILEKNTEMASNINFNSENESLTISETVKELHFEESSELISSNPENNTILEEDQEVVADVDEYSSASDTVKNQEFEEIDRKLSENISPLSENMSISKENPELASVVDGNEFADTSLIVKQKHLEDNIQKSSEVISSNTVLEENQKIAPSVETESSEKNMQILPELISSNIEDNTVSEENQKVTFNIEVSDENESLEASEIIKQGECEEIVRKLPETISPIAEENQEVASNINVSCENESLETSKIIKQGECEEIVRNLPETTSPIPEENQEVASNIDVSCKNESLENFETIKQGECEEIIRNLPETISSIPEENQEVVSNIDVTCENEPLENSEIIKQGKCEETVRNLPETILSIPEENQEIVSNVNCENEPLEKSEIIKQGECEEIIRNLPETISSIAEENQEVASNIDVSCENEPLENSEILKQGECEETVKNLPETILSIPEENREIVSNVNCENEPLENSGIIKQGECEETVRNLPEAILSIPEENQEVASNIDVSCENESLETSEIIKQRECEEIVQNLPETILSIPEENQEVVSNIDVSCENESLETSENIKQGECEEIVRSLPETILPIPEENHIDVSCENESSDDIEKRRECEEIENLPGNDLSLTEFNTISEENQDVAANIDVSCEDESELPEIRQEVPPSLPNEIPSSVVKQYNIGHDAEEIVKDEFSLSDDELPLSERVLKNLRKTQSAENKENERNSTISSETKALEIRDELKENKIVSKINGSIIESKEITSGRFQTNIHASVSKFTFYQSTENYHFINNDLPPIENIADKTGDEKDPKDELEELYNSNAAQNACSITYSIPTNSDDVEAPVEIRIEELPDTEIYAHNEVINERRISDDSGLNVLAETANKCKYIPITPESNKNKKVGKNKQARSRLIIPNKNSFLQRKNLLQKTNTKPRLNFKPNEFKGVVGKQSPHRVYDATYNIGHLSSSEDSCDSFKDNLIIAEETNKGDVNKFEEDKVEEIPILLKDVENPFRKPEIVKESKTVQSKNLKPKKERKPKNVRFEEEVITIGRCTRSKRMPLFTENDILLLNKDKNEVSEEVKQLFSVNLKSRRKSKSDNSNLNEVKGKQKTTKSKNDQIENKPTTDYSIENILNIPYNLRNGLTIERIDQTPAVPNEAPLNLSKKTMLNPEVSIEIINEPPQKVVEEKQIKPRRNTTNRKKDKQPLNIRKEVETTEYTCEEMCIPLRFVECTIKEIIEPKVEIMEPKPAQEKAKIWQPFKDVAETSSKGNDEKLEGDLGEIVNVVVQNMMDNIVELEEKVQNVQQSSSGKQKKISKEKTPKEKKANKRNNIPKNFENSNFPKESPIIKELGNTMEVGNINKFEENLINQIPEHEEIVVDIIENEVGKCQSTSVHPRKISKQRIPKEKKTSNISAKVKENLDIFLDNQKEEIQKKPINELGGDASNNVEIVVDVIENETEKCPQPSSFNGRQKKIAKQQISREKKSSKKVIDNLKENHGDDVIKPVPTIVQVGNSSHVSTQQDCSTLQDFPTLHNLISQDNVDKRRKRATNNKKKQKNSLLSNPVVTDKNTDVVHNLYIVNELEVKDKMPMRRTRRNSSFIDKVTEDQAQEKEKFLKNYELIEKVAVKEKRQLRRTRSNSLANNLTDHVSEIFPIPILEKENTKEHAGLKQNVTKIVEFREEIETKKGKYSPKSRRTKANNRNKKQNENLKKGKILQDQVAFKGSIPRRFGIGKELCDIPNKMTTLLEEDEVEEVNREEESNQDLMEESHQMKQLDAEPVSKNLEEAENNKHRKISTQESFTIEGLEEKKEESKMVDMPELKNEEFAEINKTVENCSKHEEVIGRNDIEINVDLKGINDTNMEEVNNINVEDVNNINVENVININVEVVNDINVKDVNNLNVEDVNDINVEEVNNVNVEDTNDINVKEINVNDKEVKEGNDRNVHTLNINEVNDVNMEEFDNINVEKRNIKMEDINPININNAVQMESIGDTNPENTLISQREILGASQSEDHISFVAHENKENKLDEATLSPGEGNVEYFETTENFKIIQEDLKDISDDSKQILEDSKGLSEDSKGVSEDSKEISENSKEISEDLKEISDDSKRFLEDSKQISDMPQISNEISADPNYNITKDIGVDIVTKEIVQESRKSEDNDLNIEAPKEINEQEIENSTESRIIPDKEVVINDTTEKLVEYNKKEEINTNNVLSTQSDTNQIREESKVSLDETIQLDGDLKESLNEGAKEETKGIVGLKPKDSQLEETVASSITDENKQGEDVSLNIAKPPERVGKRKRFESIKNKEETYHKIMRISDQDILANLPENISSMFKYIPIVKIRKIRDLQTFRDEYVSSLRSKSDDKSKSCRSKGRNLDAIVDKLVTYLKRNETEKLQLSGCLNENRGESAGHLFGHVKSKIKEAENHEEFSCESKENSTAIIGDTEIVNNVEKSNWEKKSNEDELKTSEEEIIQSMDIKDVGIIDEEKEINTEQKVMNEEKTLPENTNQACEMISEEECVVSVENEKVSQENVINQDVIANRNDVEMKNKKEIDLIKREPKISTEKDLNINSVEMENLKQKELTEEPKVSLDLNTSNVQMADLGKKVLKKRKLKASAKRKSRNIKKNEIINQIKQHKEKMEISGNYDGVNERNVEITYTDEKRLNEQLKNLTEEKLNDEVLNVNNVKENQQLETLDKQEAKTSSKIEINQQVETRGEEKVINPNFECVQMVHRKPRASKKRKSKASSKRKVNRDIAEEQRNKDESQKLNTLKESEQKIPMNCDKPDVLIQSENNHCVVMDVENVEKTLGEGENAICEVEKTKENDFKHEEIIETNDADTGKINDVNVEKESDVNIEKVNVVNMEVVNDKVLDHKQNGLDKKKSKVSTKRKANHGVIVHDEENNISMDSDKPKLQTETEINHYVITNDNNTDKPNFEKVNVVNMEVVSDKVLDHKQNGLDKKKSKVSTKRKANHGVIVHNEENNISMDSDKPKLQTETEINQYVITNENNTDKLNIEKVNVVNMEVVNDKMPDHKQNGLDKKKSKVSTKRKANHGVIVHDEENNISMDSDKPKLQTETEINPYVITNDNNTDKPNFEKVNVVNMEVVSDKVLDHKQNGLDKKKSKVSTKRKANHGVIVHDENNISMDSDKPKLQIETEINPYVITNENNTDKPNIEKVNVENMEVVNDKVPNCKQNGLNKKKSKVSTKRKANHGVIVHEEENNISMDSDQPKLQTETEINHYVITNENNIDKPLCEDECKGKMDGSMENEAQNLRQETLNKEGSITSSEVFIVASSEEINQDFKVKNDDMANKIDNNCDLKPLNEKNAEIPMDYDVVNGGNIEMGDQRQETLNEGFEVQQKINHGVLASTTHVENMEINQQEEILTGKEICTEGEINLNEMQHKNLTEEEEPVILDKTVNPKLTQPRKVRSCEIGEMCGSLDEKIPSNTNLAMEVETQKAVKSNNEELSSKPNYSYLKVSHDNRIQTSMEENAQEIKKSSENQSKICEEISERKEENIKSTENREPSEKVENVSVTSESCLQKYSIEEENHDTIKHTENNSLVEAQNSNLEKSISTSTEDMLEGENQNNEKMPISTPPLETSTKVDDVKRKERYEITMDDVPIPRNSEIVAKIYPKKIQQPIGQRNKDPIGEIIREPVGKMIREPIGGTIKEIIKEPIEHMIKETIRQPIEESFCNNSLLTECSLKVRPAKELLEKYKFMQEEYDTSSSDYEINNSVYHPDTKMSAKLVPAFETASIEDSNIETSETVIEDSYIDQNIPFENGTIPCIHELNAESNNSNFDNSQMLPSNLTPFPQFSDNNILDCNNQPISQSILNVSFDADQFLSDVMLDKRLPYLESCSEFLGSTKYEVDAQPQSPHTKIIPTLSEEPVISSSDGIIGGNIEKIPSLDVEGTTSEMIGNALPLCRLNQTIDVDDPQLAEKVKSMGLVKIGSESSDHDYINYGGPLLVGKYETPHNAESPEMSPSRQISIGAHTESAMVPVSSHDSLVNNVAEQFNPLPYNFIDTQDYSFMNKVMANVIHHQVSIADTSAHFENTITFSNDNLLSSTRIDDANGPDFTINSFPLSDLALCDIEDFYASETISPDKIIVNPLKTLHTIPKNVVDIPQKVTVKVNEYEFASSDNLFKQDGFVCPNTVKNTNDALLECLKKVKEKELKRDKAKMKIEKKIELSDAFPIRRNNRTPVSAPRLPKKKEKENTEQDAKQTLKYKSELQKWRPDLSSPEAINQSSKTVTEEASKQNYLETILPANLESQEELEMKPDKLAKLIFATFDDTDLLNVDSPTILESPTRVTVKINEYEYASTDNLYNVAYGKGKKEVVHKKAMDKPKPLGKKLDFSIPKTENATASKNNEVTEKKIENQVNSDSVEKEKIIEAKPIVQAIKENPLEKKSDDIQVKKNECDDPPKKKEIDSNVKVAQKEKKIKDDVQNEPKEKEAVAMQMKIPKVQDKPRPKEKIEAKPSEPTRESRDKTDLVPTTVPMQKYQSEVQRWRPEVLNYHQKMKSISNSSSYPRLPYSVSQRPENRNVRPSPYVRKEEMPKPNEKPMHNPNPNKNYYPSSSNSYTPQPYYPRQDSWKYDRPPSRTEQRKPIYPRPERSNMQEPPKSSSRNPPTTDKSYWDHKNANRPHQSRSERITGNDYQKQNDQRGSAIYNRVPQSRSERNSEPPYSPLDSATFSRNKYDEIKRRSYEKSLKNQVNSNSHERYYQLLRTSKPPERQKRKSPSVEHNGTPKVRKFEEDRKEGQQRKRTSSPCDDAARKRQKDYDEIFSKLREEGNINKNFKLKFPLQSPSSDNCYSSPSSQSSSNDNWFEKFPEQFLLKEARYVTFGGLTKRNSDKHN